MDFETLKAELKTTADGIKEMKGGFEDRLSQLEVARNRKMLDRPDNGTNHLAAQIMNSAQFKSFTEGNSSTVQIPLEQKALVTGDDGANSSSNILVRPDRYPDIIDPAQRVLRIRELLPNLPTNSNSVEYTREASFTNSAGEQGNEGTAKAESEFTFELARADVATVAHFANVSRQALDDSATLQNFLDNRLIYGLRLVTEDLLLNGTGKINGFTTVGQHTVFNRYPAGGTKLDILAAAGTQLQLSDNVADAVVLNPSDFEEIRLLKDSTGQYLFGYPSSDLPPRLWGMQVVVTNSISEGEFMMMDRQRAAIIFDRQMPSIEISRSHGDNFTKNVVTILAEERLALAVVRPQAVIYGLFLESS